MRPPEVAGHVGAKGDYTFALDPLEYRLRTVSGKLVMRIHNPTGEPITLMGGQSTAVDPRGQSHPLRTTTMAPGSFIKLILPPPRPRVYRGGPTFGIGVGTRVGRAGRYGYYGHAFENDWPHDEPQYLTVYDDADTAYWNWPGEGDVRLMLVFDRAAKPFTHELLLRRVKVN